MSDFDHALKPTDTPEPSFVEFVAIIAALIGLTAFSIDNLLPAFGQIAQSLALDDPNKAQLIVIIFMISFSIMDLFYGPMSDRFGRKPMLLCGLLIYVIGTLIGLLSSNFALLLLGRFLQGAGASSPRVLAIAIVRDRYRGREMSRIMSLAMTVFFIVPVIAPTTGSLVLMLGSWRLIFVNMLVFGLLLTIWVAVRLPETFVPVKGSESILQQTIASFRIVCTNRQAMVYTTIASLLTGCLITYVVSSPQIFDTVIYRLGRGFPLVFGLLAVFMSLASFVNSSLVRRVGMHRLSSIGIAAFVLVAAMLLVSAIGFSGKPPLVLTVAALAALHFLFCLTSPNLNAIAMEPLGEVAGAASSFIGFYATMVGAIIGYGFGHAFNGTIIPLAICYLTMGLVSLAILLWDRRVSLKRRSEAS